LKAALEKNRGKKGGKKLRNHLRGPKSPVVSKRQDIRWGHDTRKRTYKGVRGHVQKKKGGLYGVKRNYWVDEQGTSLKEKQGKRI